LRTVGTEQTLKKAARNWHDGKMKWQHWKHTESLLFFYSVHKLDIIGKEYVIGLQIFSVSQSQIFLLKSVNI